MKPVISSIVFLTTFVLSTAITCKPSGIMCLNNKQFQFCTKSGNNKVYISGKVITCPARKSCDDTFKFFPCVDTPPTTTPAPVTPPGCYGPDKYIGPKCYQYFECVSKLWWWEPRLVTCSEGEAFNLGLQKCVSAKMVNCYLDYIPTETTTLPITTQQITTTTEVPPSCSGDHKVPSINCNEYYQCVSVFWWWEPHKITCPQGEAFVPSENDCKSVEWRTCPRTFPPTTTTEIPTTTTPETEPLCNNDIERYPSSKCNEYYQCVNVWWWWYEPRKRICPNGEAFDDVLNDCKPVEPSSCPTSFTTIPVSTSTSSFASTVEPTKVPDGTKLPFTTMSVPTSTTDFISPPDCSGAGKFPAAMENQYYECVSKWWWWWEPRLNTCPDSTVFDFDQQNCVENPLN